MAVTKTVLINLQGKDDVSDELKTVEKNTQKTTKGFESLEGRLVTLQAAFAVAGVAVAAFAGTIGKSIKLFAEQEKAEKKLQNAMKITGQFSEKNFQSFKAFATQLQQNSTIGDEVSLSLLGVAKAMRLTDDQSTKLVQAAADLSAVTGRDIKTSFDTLAKSLSGTAGRLAEVAPEIKNFTQEQLKAGEAIDLIADKFAGFASAELQTFSGAMTAVGNTVGDTFEEVGRVIVAAFDVPGLADVAIQALTSFQTFLQKKYTAGG